MRYDVSHPWNNDLRQCNVQVLGKVRMNDLHACTLIFFGLKAQNGVQAPVDYVLGGAMISMGKHVLNETTLLHPLMPGGAQRGTVNFNTNGV